MELLFRYVETHGTETAHRRLSQHAVTAQLNRPRENKDANDFFRYVMQRQTVTS